MLVAGGRRLGHTQSEGKSPSDEESKPSMPEFQKEVGQKIKGKIKRYIPRMVISSDKKGPCPPRVKNSIFPWHRGPGLLSYFLPGPRRLSLPLSSLSEPAIGVAFTVGFAGETPRRASGDLSLSVLSITEVVAERVDLRVLVGYG
ncbi:hypothetical protein SAY86_002514 [Trapa natans]|uniref:Uncharacterized protein n=1 Tax=Trapa natans TaxID=22666 RepID=A0AAN7R2I7_TRANT|nr:hypothetical protein SAY86_002514 [Trapa natans]